MSFVSLSPNPAVFAPTGPAATVREHLFFFLLVLVQTKKKQCVLQTAVKVAPPDEWQRPKKGGIVLVCVFSGLWCVGFPSVFLGGGGGRKRRKARKQDREREGLHQYVVSMSHVCVE